MNWRDKFSSLMIPPPLPEHERQKAVLADAAVIGEFLEWLQREMSDRVSAGKRDPDVYPAFQFATGSIQKLLEQYFRIDPDKLEQEKRELLAQQRLLNEWSGIRKELGLDRQ
jgi:hypothetical protein